MVETIAITKAVTKLRDVHEKFGLSRENDPQFFTEWFENLPDVTEAEQTELEHLKQRYLYYIEDGEISEGTVNIIMISPLLNIIGLCDPPDRIRGEKSVRLQLRTEDETGEIVLEGRIDALTLQDEFWLIVVAGKRGGFSVLQAVPQALTYMMATPHPDRPIFALVTNGYDYLFIKLMQPDRRYALSHNFTLLSDRDNNLQRVVRVIKKLVDWKAGGHQGEGFALG